jgi:hypothetical protein
VKRYTLTVAVKIRKMRRCYMWGICVALGLLTPKCGQAQVSRAGTVTNDKTPENKNNYWLGVGVGTSQFPSAMLALGYGFIDKPTRATPSTVKCYLLTFPP